MGRFQNHSTKASKSPTARGNSLIPGLAPSVLTVLASLPTFPPTVVTQRSVKDLCGSSKQKEILHWLLSPLPATPPLQSTWREQGGYGGGHNTLSQEVPVLEACTYFVGLTDSEFVINSNMFPHPSLLKTPQLLANDDYIFSRDVALGSLSWSGFAAYRSSVFLAWLYSWRRRDLTWGLTEPWRGRGSLTHSNSK